MNKECFWLNWSLAVLLGFVVGFMFGYPLGRIDGRMDRPIRACIEQPPQQQPYPKTKAEMKRWIANYQEKGNTQ